MTPDAEGLLETIFTPGGLLARVLPAYEDRPEQLEMARLVWTCLREGCHGLVEAGTGVGKSLAYLIPAALWALSRSKRVVISTHTINLQEQLVQKDIPTAERILAELDLGPLRAVLVKGRNHYLCRRRLEQETGAREQQLSLGLVADEADLATRRLLEWSRTPGATGDRADLTFSVAPAVWGKVQSDSDECAGEKCPFREECFFRRARRRQEQAHLLVTNHALFCADLRIRGETGGLGVLASHDATICDEAHHLERVAADHLGTRLTGYRFAWLADAVEDLVRQQRVRSSLSEHTLRRYEGTLARIRQSSADFFEDLGRRLRSAFSTGPPRPLRLRTRLNGFGDLLGELARLAEALEQIAAMGISEEHAQVATNHATRCRALAGELEQVATLARPLHACWLEPAQGTRFGGVALCSAPVSVAEALADLLFSNTRSVLLTSATLAVGGDFTYTASSLGVSEYRGLVLGSPFDYRRQALLCVPEDAPTTDPNRPDYLAYVARKVHETVTITRGRAFVLFTSYQAMNRVYAEVAPHLEEIGYAPLKQGDGPRDLLLEQFRRDTGSVLFGVDSFWEGVDVPGEALSCVIIARLPFEVPDEPLVEARCEYLRSLGKDPFQEYTLPRTAIRLKQGFGRLIRTRTDRGAVVVLDHRLATRRYGRYLMAALPPVRTTTDLTEVALLLAGRPTAGGPLPAPRPTEPAGRRPPPSGPAPPPG